MLKDLMPYWPIASFALQGVLGIVICLAVLKMKEVAAAVAKALADPIAEAVDDLDTRVTEHNGRIGELEKDVLNLPTKEDIARVEGKVDATARDVGAVANGVGRIESIFLEAGFLGVMLFGLNRVGKHLHFFATCAVAGAARQRAVSSVRADFLSPR